VAGVAGWVKGDGWFAGFMGMRECALRGQAGLRVWEGAPEGLPGGCGAPGLTRPDLKGSPP
jgi:hypothetical protein